MSAKQTALSSTELLRFPRRVPDDQGHFPPGNNFRSSRLK